MDDVLSHGRDREPGRRTGRLAVVVVLAVLAVVIAWHLPRGRAVPPRPASAAVTVGPVQLAGLGSGAAGLLDGGGRDHRAGHAAGRQLRGAGHCRALLAGSPASGHGRCRGRPARGIPGSARG
jgi:hypothetical protein